jgi:hypothetical protein
MLAGDAGRTGSGRTTGGTVIAGLAVASRRTGR